MTALVVIMLIVGWVLLSSIIGISVCMVSSRVSQMEETVPVSHAIKPSHQTNDNLSTNLPSEPPEIAAAPSSSN